MKIDRLHIEAFGHFAAFQLPLKPGLNLVHGENEAGKTTLLAFIRAVLFGFEGRKSNERYELSPGVFGGELWLSTERGPLRVRRMGAKKVEGELTVRGASGEVEPPGLLGEALHGVSRELYFQLFAFGLDELASFDRLAQHSSVTEALFAAGMQGARRLPEVSAQLRRSSEELFKPGGRKQKLNEVLGQLEDVRAELSLLGDPPARYFELIDLRANLDREAAALDGALRTARAERERLFALEKVSPSIIALERLDEELRALPAELDAFPVNGVVRLEAALDAERRAALDVAETAEQLEAVRLALESNRASLLPLDHAAQLRAAREGFAARLELARSLPSRRAELNVRRRHAHEAVAQLGLGVGPEALLKLDASTSARTQLASRVAAKDSAARALREVEQGALELQSRLDEVRAERQRRVQEHDLLCPVNPAELRRRQNALIRLPSLELETKRIEDQEKDLRRELQEVKAAQEAPPEEPVPPWWIIAALLFGVAVSVAAYLYDGPITAAVAAAVGAVLAGAIALLQRRSVAAHREAMAAHTARAERRDAQAARLSESLIRTQQRLEQVVLDRALASQEAGIPLENLRGASDPQLKLAQDEVSELLRQSEQRALVARELATLDDRERRLAQELEAVKARLDAAGTELSRAAQSLAALLEERGLPATLDGETAKTIFNAVAESQRSLRDVAALEVALRADEAGCEAAARLLGDAARVAKLTASGEAPLVQAEGLLAPAGEVLERRIAQDHELERLEERLGELTLRGKRAEGERAHQEGLVRTLLDHGAAADAETFRRRAGEAARRAEVLTEQRSHRAAIESATRTNADTAAEQLAQAGGPASIGERARSQAEAVERLDAEQKRVEQRRGEVRGELTTLETDERVAELRQQEERLVEEAKVLARRYARDRLGLAILSRARERFEREQQPRVVKLASARFAQLTGGRYQRVFVPAGEETVLRVLDLHGEEKTAEQLSRGTREQLYLAFRLAVVEDFADTRGPLPVVLDDILVNFDPRRAKNAVKTLVALSERHQLIAFTCHPWVRELFAEQGAHVAELGRPSERAVVSLRGA